MLINIQDDITPIFTEYILNSTASNRVKYEIIVVLHNLLCINTDIRVRREFLSILCARIDFLLVDFYEFDFAWIGYMSTYEYTSEW